MGTLKTRLMATACGCCLVLIACSPSAPPTPTSQAPAPAARQSRNVEPAPAREVLAETLPYAEIGDELVYGYFAIPVDMIDPLPAVLMIHDWYGLDDNVRKLAERLAGDGYIVLAVDLFLGRTADSVGIARTLEIDVAENPERARDNLSQAAEFIRDSSGAPALAVMGFGFGGGWALNTLLQMPGQLDAGISYYGQVRNDADRLQAVDVPFIGFFVENDRAIPVQSVRDFEETMRSLSKDVDIQIYDTGRRGFAIPGSDAYQRDLAEDAWARMLAFLEVRLDTDN